MDKLITELLMEDLMVGEGGVVKLYHYADAKDEELVLDPTRFGESAFSRREKQRSEVPRVFFYVDPSQKESFFSGRELYTTQVPESLIYNLDQDSDRMKKNPEFKINAYSDAIDYDSILQHLSGWRYPDGWGKPAAKTGEQRYGGAYYDVGSFQCVAWFDYISVRKVSQDERDSLENPLGSNNAIPKQ